MKLILTLSLALTGAFARAEKSARPPSPGDVMIASILEGRHATTISGVSEAGEPCALLVRNPSPGVYYVIVVKLPVGGKREKGRTTRDFANDFVGVMNVNAREEVEGPRIRLASQKSWDNDSTRNTVEVEMQNGRPVMAAGVSDLRAFVCTLAKR